MAGRNSDDTHSADHNPSDFIFRVVVLGDECTGKTSLVRAFAPTPSADGESAGLHCRQVLLTNDIKVNLQVKDLSYYDRFQSARSYLRNTIGSVICYDITNRDSFQRVLKYYRKIRRNIFLVNGPIHLVGCKYDLRANREVFKWEAQKLALEFDMLFYETSAVTRANVDLTFLNLSLEIFDRLERHEFSLEPGFTGLQLTSSLQRLSTCSKLYAIYERVAELYELSMMLENEESGESGGDTRFVQYPRRRRVRHYTGMPEYAPGYNQERIQAENRRNQKQDNDE